jgi:hypothetical protein
MKTLTDGFVSANPYRVERAKTMATAAVADPAAAGRH